MALPPNGRPRPKVRQTSWRPTRKLTAAVATGGAGGFILYLLDWAGLPPMDPGVAAWLAAAIGGIIGYFVKDRANV